MCIITAPYAIVHPLAVVVASINTIVALHGGLAFSCMSIGGDPYHSTVIRPWRTVSATTGAVFYGHPGEFM